MISLLSLDCVEVVWQSHHEEVAIATSLPVVLHVGEVTSNLGTDGSSSGDGGRMIVQGGDVSLDSIPDTSCSEASCERTACYQVISRFGEADERIFLYVYTINLSYLISLEA